MFSRSAAVTSVTRLLRPECLAGRASITTKATNNAFVKINSHVHQATTTTTFQVMSKIISNNTQSTKSWIDATRSFASAAILKNHSLVFPCSANKFSAALSWRDDCFIFSSSTQQQQQSRSYSSNRSRRGLYDGKDIRSGSNVSFSMRNTKRKFKPNVFVKRVYSETLQEMIPFHLTAQALRSIDKAGGLDAYLLQNAGSITEGEGAVVKRKILKRLKNQARMERKATEQQQGSSVTTTAEHQL